MDTTLREIIEREFEEYIKIKNDKKILKSILMTRKNIQEVHWLIEYINDISPFWYNYWEEMTWDWTRDCEVFSLVQELQLKITELKTKWLIEDFNNLKKDV